MIAAIVAMTDRGSRVLHCKRNTRLCVLCALFFSTKEAITTLWKCFEPAMHSVKDGGIDDMRHPAQQHMLLECSPQLVTLPPKGDYDGYLGGTLG